MTDAKTPQPDTHEPSPPEPASKRPLKEGALPKEIGGAPGPEPTRYGDWQHKGRVTDF